VTPSTYSSHPFFDWAPDLDTPTPTGTNVPIDAGGVDITFSGVASAGTTTVSRIPTSSAGTAPNGFVIGGIAYEITTSAAYTAPVTVCFNVPTTVASSQSAFNALNLMHNEGGVLVNRTTSRDFPTRTICGSVTTLSPFVLAEQVDPTLPSITGYVEDSNGAPMVDVDVELSGAENRLTQTDVNGFFSFVNLTEGESYTVQPKRVGFLFNQYSRDFFSISLENSVVFVGTAINFRISGRIFDTNGIPVAGKVVELEGDSFAAATTDLTGSYSFDDLPADGNFVLRMSPGNPEIFSPAAHSINRLTNELAGVDFTQFAPTAANVSVGGRVLDSAGRGIRNAQVSLIDQAGIVRRTRSSTFGYFRFDDIEAGQSVIVSVSANRYRFTTQTQLIDLVDNVTDVDFVADRE
jgi:hypothetical protein